MANSFLIPLLCVITIIAVLSRSLSDSESSKLISDGLHTPNYLRLNPLSLSAEEESMCKQTYRFLPCTTTVLGNLFLIIVYGYLMFVAATYLTDGTELLLSIRGPGVVGGLSLPIFGDLPGAMIIFVSGLSESKEVAQSQVAIGMGMLAGSTIMLITVIWGSCVIVGKCDLGESAAVNGQDTKGFDLTGSGVSTDLWTCYAARIMAISVIPFIVVQLPQLLNSNSAKRLAILIALIVSVSLLISFCVCQVFQKKFQKRRIAYAKHRHVISGILKHLSQRALGRLLNDLGEPNIDVIKRLFDAIDENKDSHLSASELKAFIIGIRFDEIHLDHDDAVEKLLTDIDMSNDSLIDIDEFITVVSKWLNEAKRGRPADAGPETIKQTRQEHALLLGAEDQSDEIVEGVENPKWNSFKAKMMLLLGTIIAAALADPLVDAVDNFSNATSIPSFFVSFIVLPLATNLSEAVTAIIFAGRKKIRTVSLTFSELYGIITTNNVVSPSVFLALVYVRELTWEFSSEVLVILIVCLVMGGLTSFRTRFPLWTCFVAYILYPFSLALIYVLHYVFGWS
ncbi:hypothetical protein LWI28_012053 [Acer negundo]|uniref:EF-hand domain-containing protein n=1 Tax=Acer negundo TaxID=4023 RepID=A0AAD5NWK0_ACENE|nr:hypothetical protein LWI28_012053 [Acer negundo]